MRIFWLCLLIALMPLRLWAGSAMAIEHAQPSHPVEQVAAPHHCHEAAAADTSDALPEPASTHDKHSGCLNCDICHSLVLSPTSGWVGATTPAQSAPPHHSQAVTSSTLPRLIKPPIA